MPTSTIPPALTVLLKLFKTNLTAMSKHTGISRSRLIALFQNGEYSNSELGALLDCLQTRFAIAFYRSSQKGNFNQAGTGHRQKTTIINNITHVTNNNTVVIQGPLTVEEPKPKALAGPSHRWDSQPVQPGGQVHQIGQPQAVRELERAA
jgi:hypothetical protein